MGQYYRQYVKNMRTRKEHIFGCQLADNDDWNGLKLMEHSWFYNSFVMTICGMIYQEPSRVMWIGDYSNDTMYDKTDRVGEILDKLEQDAGMIMDPDWDRPNSVEPEYDGATNTKQGEHVNKISCAIRDGHTDEIVSLVKKLRTEETADDVDFCLDEIQEVKKFMRLYNKVYADDRKEEKPERDEMSLRGYLLVNHSKKEYLSGDEYFGASNTEEWYQAQDGHTGWYVDCVHPLPLLTCVGNGLGGGDYSGSDMELVGYWCGDVISLEDDDFDISEFDKILPVFMEDCERISM